MRSETLRTGEEFQYKSWKDDPELVDDLVNLLGTKTVQTASSDAKWKYSKIYLYRELFRTKETELERPYTRAPIPKTTESFETTLNLLGRRELNFGPGISQELQDRFHSVMGERRNVGALELGEHMSFWSRDKIILASGLMGYCGFSGNIVARLFSQFFQYPSEKGSNIGSILTITRDKGVFPFEKGRGLKLNTPQVTFFVEELRLLTGMSLRELRDWFIFHAPDVDARYSRTADSLKILDGFISAYEKSSATK